MEKKLMDDDTDVCEYYDEGICDGHDNPFKDRDHPQCAKCRRV
jgi:hypothetical protein